MSTVVRAATTMAQQFFELLAKGDIDDTRQAAEARTVRR